MLSVCRWRWKHDNRDRLNQELAKSRAESRISEQRNLLIAAINEAREERNEARERARTTEALLCRIADGIASEGEEGESGVMTHSKLTLAQIDDLIEASDNRVTVLTEDGWFLLDIEKGDSPVDIADKMTNELCSRYPSKRFE
jgi:uncharacterized coiled-coil DUF342 family protein